MYLLVLCQYLHVSAEGMWTPVFQGASATVLGVRGPAVPRHCCSPPRAAARGRGPTPGRSRDPAAPCSSSTTTRGQGSSSPLFYINTSGVLQPPQAVLHQHVGHHDDLAHWHWRARRFEKVYKCFHHVNWKCVLHRPYLHHWQTGSLTDSLSGAPLAYPQADMPVYICRYKQMPWHTCRYMNRYMQI